MKKKSKEVPGPLVGSLLKSGNFILAWDGKPYICFPSQKDAADWLKTAADSILQAKFPHG